MRLTRIECNMKMRDVLLTVCFISHQVYFACCLHKNLKYYETLDASNFEHKIVKRGVQHSQHPYNKINEVEFYTHGRNFRLFLTPRREVVHSNFKAYEVNGDGKETTIHVDHENFYHGRVFGEVDSHAHVHIDDGMVTATIALPDDTFHIEVEDRNVNTIEFMNKNHYYRTRIFPETQITLHLLNYDEIEELNSVFNQPSWRHLPHADNKSMIAYKGSNVKLSWEHFEGGEGHTHGVPKTCGYVKEETDEEEDDDELDDVESRSNNRTKRQTETYEYTPTKTRCPLLLVADYRFYQEMGASNTKTTINYLISLIDRVHKIYNDTLWQERQEQDGFKGMGFVIKKIVVHSEPTRMRGGETHYNMVREKWDVRTLLEVFSREYSHKDFCLAHLFTDLKFEGGILGLAYVGSPRRNSVGGICTPEYFKNGYTLYLNSGLSSSRNHYGQRVITREADLVTAHEFGHNWGSEHDPDITECSPSASQGGSYLMYTYSVSGYDVNNKRFSPCSLRSIRKVLQAKSGRCFSEPEESFCGNLRVEGDEECDAGLLGTEDNDSCCDKNCKLRRNQGAVCSDKNSPCCQNCAFMQINVKCRDAQYATCEQESRCTGTSSECPRSPAMNDGTGCLERGQCRLGKCVPYCETQGLQSCMCDTIGDACKRCCRMSLNETCFPVDPQDILPDGTPCIQGFCNKGVCEKTIQDVVERFWDIIEDININKVMRFLKDNIVGAVIICTAIIWIPASCVVSYIDRRRIKEAEKKWRWKHTDELIHPEDQRRIVHIQSASRQRAQPS